MRRRSLQGKHRIFNNYLTIEVLDDNFWFTLGYGEFYYCIDFDGNWIYVQEGDVSVDKGHFISLKANRVPDGTGIGYIDGEGRFNLHGNCMSLLYGDNAADYTSVPDNAFLNLLAGSNVVNVSKTFLPATTLGKNCYNRMFSDCPYLIVAPELPATTLAFGCYQQMFQGCTKLTTAPELPAITLPAHCYRSMFEDCSKLNYIKMLATDISASNCLGYWVSGVASSGVFVKNKDAIWEKTGVDGVPSGWTVLTE